MKSPARSARNEGGEEVREAPPRGGMGDEVAALFSDAADFEAYRDFVEHQGPAEGFELGEPALVCRWRLAGRHVPMLNRHVRALSQRRVMGAPVRRNLISWAKQHIEWSLAETPFPQVDGVLMLVIDRNGNAAMSVGDYAPLPDRSLAALRERAAGAEREGAQTGVAPETLCVVAGGALVAPVGEGRHACGTLTLVEQLAAARKIPVTHGALTEAELAASADRFLVSDEHGVVCDEDATGPLGRFMGASYEKLRSSAR